MKKLHKIEMKPFNEVYQATTVVTTKDFRKVTRTVTCLLDDNCVRYTVVEDGKAKSRREYGNDQKERCFRNAEKALNR